MPDDQQTPLNNMTLSHTSRVVLTTRGGGGLLLPVYDSYEELPLRYADICMILELARGEEDGIEGAVQRTVSRLQDDVDPQSLRELAQALRDRGLLNDGGARVEPHHDRTAPSVPPSVVQEDQKVLVARMPQIFIVSADGFEVTDHSGEVGVCLSPEELMAFAVFRAPHTWPEAHATHLEECGERALDEDAFQKLIARLWGAGLMGKHSPTENYGERGQRLWQGVFKRVNRVDRALSRGLPEYERVEEQRRARTGKGRVRVVPVMRHGSLPPLALGMLLGSAREYRGGWLRQYYHFVPDMRSDLARLDEYSRDHGVYLFSNYVWSHSDNMWLCERIKKANPNSVTVHGGPDTPRYPHEVEAYFRDHPEVDVVIHGEGEETVCRMLEALVGAFSEDGVDLSCLHGVQGLSFRDGDLVVQNLPRPQIQDLDSIPSPYLNGLFSAYEGANPQCAVIETNRGCPYACTFCDWGAATNSKVRLFSLDRVFAELEWCAQNRVNDVTLADANYGMLERDVAIAEKVAELNHKYGFPRLFHTSFAKNKTKYLSEIIRILVQSGVVTEGVLSLQSMDQQTLSAVHRSNIKTEKYDELAQEFRELGLPLFVDLMIGLPGATPASFRDDLQGCIDREVGARCYQTELLANSPMNDPEYREKHQIETEECSHGPGAASGDGFGRRIVVATSTFSRADYDEMLDLRDAYRVFDKAGVLRHVTRFVRQECGVREIDFIDHLRREARAYPERWPHTAFSLRAMLYIMAPPVSWRLLLDEVERFLKEHYSIADDDALRTVFDVQHAVLPARGRALPETLSLPHDYAAWYDAMISAKNSGAFTAWEEHVPHLREYPAAQFTVDDPTNMCVSDLGFTSEEADYTQIELESPIARPTPPEHVRFDEPA